MEISHLYQSSPIRKISSSTLQFRQLIDSLRNNLTAKKDTLFPTPSAQAIKQQQRTTQEQNTEIAIQVNSFSQNISLLPSFQSDSTLQLKPKMLVGGRDKLKKLNMPIDNNPEIIPLQSKQICQHKEKAQILNPDNNLSNLQSFRLSPKKNVSTQYQSSTNAITNAIPLFSPRSDFKKGQIVRQKIQNNPEKESQSDNGKKIRDINETKVIEFTLNEKKINDKSDPSEIFNFFTNLALSCDIIIKNPSIKKYKNCVYFGHPIRTNNTYEGFLYFYDHKIYYGQFMNGYKHGLGVELNLTENIKCKGEFKEGHKTGKFYIEKPNQKYIGYLENGLYQGEGRLTTQDYIYQGIFEKGEKNGYGEQFYPKTGVRISGTFKNGVLEKSKTSKSIPEFRSRTKISSSKQKQKVRLEQIRKQSLEKHNERMNKLRQRSQKDSEYEIQFETREEYSQPPILHLNSSRLDMYRPRPQRLPKICQEFEYSFQAGNKYSSINSKTDEFSDIRPDIIHPKKQFCLDRKEQRMETGQLEEPLPTPCLTVFGRRR